MSRPSNAYTVTLAMTLIGLSTASAVAQFQTKEAAGHRLVETASEISIYRDESKVLTYNIVSPPVPEGISSVYRRSGFLHPVSSPKGRVVTATFPFDHPHQHGVFSAWVKTHYGDRSVDFWNLAGGTGRIFHERVVSTFATENSLGFEVDLIHRATESPAIDVLRERWKITVRKSDDGEHCFDLETTQTALTDVPLVVEEYHYGGMAFRGPVSWLQTKDSDLKKRDKETETAPSDFLNDLGSERRKGNHQHAKWVALHGEIQGETVTVTVLGHPKNFRAPEAARLHPTKPYFCYAPCVDGEFSITKEKPFSAHYRYLITDTAPDVEWLNQQWMKFSK